MAKNQRTVLAKTSTGVVHVKLTAHAFKRVRDALPTPTTCRYCGNKVEFVRNDYALGYQVGAWPYLYRCTACGARVGVHPQTDIPLGTLANGRLRYLRAQSKRAFKAFLLDRMLPRMAGYRWLAQQLGIHVSSCHFGWFEIEQCERVLVVLANSHRRSRPQEDFYHGKGR